MLTTLMSITACSGTSAPAQAQDAPGPPAPAVADRPTPDAPAKAPTPGLSEPKTVEAQIQHIRDQYAKALELPQEHLSFDCPDDPMSGSFSKRARHGQLSWVSYDVGFAHGSTSLELLLEHGRVLFVLQHSAGWQFDPNAEPDSTGEGATVDYVEQNRYYFEGNQVIRALRKSARARSALKQNIYQRLDEAKNEPHPTPDGAAVLELAHALLKAHKEGQIKESWCGL